MFGLLVLQWRITALIISQTVTWSKTSTCILRDVQIEKEGLKFSMCSCGSSMVCLASGTTKFDSQSCTHLKRRDSLQRVAVCLSFHSSHTPKSPWWLNGNPFRPRWFSVTTRTQLNEETMQMFHHQQINLKFIKHHWISWSKLFYKKR